MAIYFDHSATTPVDKKVLDKMLPYFSTDFGNATSMHSYGQKSIQAIDNARQEISSFLNCNNDEIVFTSGATESNNLAIKGLIKALHSKGVKNPHIITLIIEHPAVIEPCRELISSKEVEVTFLSIKSNGVVDLDVVKSAIKDNTALISIMYANNEVGSIQPVREVGKIIKKINEKKINDWQKKRTSDREEKPQPIYFHTDATQAINFLDCNTKYLHVDMLSFSGHKIYGPKGVGALYVKTGTPMIALQRGGHQEKNYRSGTLNVTGIVGLAGAVNLIEKNQKKDSIKIREVRDYLIEQVEEKISNIMINTDREVSLPSHAHISFLKTEGESILISLDLEAGVAVSTGSACAAGDLKASYVLTAMDIKQEDTHGAIRFTLGKYNTKKEVDELMKILPNIISKLRGMSPEF